MKLRIVAAWLCLLAVLSACEDEKYESPGIPNSIETRLPKQSEVANGNRTVLVYMVAENSLSPFASADLAEMKEGLKSVDVTRNNLLVYIDDYSTPRLIRLGKNKKGQVVEETLVKYKEQSSVDVSVMRNVLQTTFKYYPAKNYGIAFWSHGEGWIPAPSTSSTRWFGQDRNNYMNISDLHQVLKSVPHFDYIFFDACFMESVEVAYELRDCGDYLISSPTEIPGPGAPYQDVIPAMFAKGNVSVKIADAYYSHYNNMYNNGINISNENWTGGVSVSVTKTGALGKLAEATSRIIPEYITGRQSVDVSEIVCYDQRNRTGYYYDLDGLIRALATEEEYRNWKSVFDETVIAWKYTETNYSGFAGGMFSMKGSAGLSTYIPHGKYDSVVNKYYREACSWYEAAGWNETGW